MGDKFNENYGKDREEGWTEKEYIFGLNKRELLVFIIILATLSLVYFIPSLLFLGAGVLIGYLLRR